MDPDNLKRAWQAKTSQTRLTIDADQLLNEVRRNQQKFAATIFWRDFREVGVAIVLVPVWFFLGITFSLPWTWYLAVPGLLWIAGFMLVDRRRHKQRPPEPHDPLSRHVESSLAEVTHQIWLLRNVFWWYLLPLLLPMLAFFAQVAWNRRSKGWDTVFGTATIVAIELLVFAGIYWLNQWAVRKHLVPKRQELESLLTSLQEDTPDKT